MHRKNMKRESADQALGSARASRAGHGALAMANFCFDPVARNEAVFRRGRRNEHARARALPGMLSTRHL